MCIKKEIQYDHFYVSSVTINYLYVSGSVPRESVHEGTHLTFQHALTCYGLSPVINQAYNKHL